MKKVLVAGAALLIAGSMVSAASAEVNLSGDARVRYVGTSDYARNITANPDGTFSEDTNGYRDNFNSRIRVKFDAKSKGGAYMKTRVRFDDITWDGQGWSAWQEAKNVWADYAYIGIPMGPVDLSGGLMPANFSKFYSWDARATRVKADFKSGNFRVIGLIDVKDEFTNSKQDEWDDNDFMGYGVVFAMKINDDWSFKIYPRYHDDQREWDGVDTVRYVPADSNDPGNISAGFVSVTDTVVTPHKDRSGFLFGANAKGKIGTFGLEADLGYKEADVLGSEDDGWGWQVTGSMDMGAFVPAVVVGGTYDGFQADDDYGFIMIGAAEPITVVKQIGLKGGDSLFAAFTANYAVSDQFKLAGNLVYYDIDLNADTEAGIPDVRGAADAWEVSGSATYTVSEGADLTYKIGYLDPSYDGRVNSAGISDDGYFGHYLRMQIKF